MLSKNNIRFIKSLAQKKFRQQHGVFVAEGDKSISELLPAFEVEQLLVVPELTSLNLSQVKGEILEVTSQEMERVSTLQNSRASLAVFKQKQSKLNIDELEKSLCLVLDGIQDPGNMGTIIRNADWFGITHILCSPDTVEVYNPKVIQATMGALAHVQVIYTDLEKLLESYKGPVYGTYLEGENIYQRDLQQTGLIVMGNEGSGIRPNLSQWISDKLFIPPFPQNSEKVESLNVGTATAIICSEFRRRG